MGSGCGGDAAGSPVIPESQRPLRRAGGGLPAEPPERAVEAVLGTVPVALCAHHGARRQGHPCMSKVASEDSAARPGADRHIVAARPSRRHGAAAAERAVGSRLRHDDSLRPPGGGGCELQPEEAGPSLARPCVPDGGHAPCAGRDVAPGNRHRSKSAAPSLWALLERLGREHWPRLVRGDKDWGSEQHGVVRGGGSRLSVQAAPDEGSAPACRAPDGA